MKKSNRKGFTIVELVIVIAVIAILAAVLIPTFASIIKKANMSADQQAVRQMNTFLASEGAVEAPTSISEARIILLEADIEMKDYKPLTKDMYFYWVKSENRIIYADKDNKVIFPAEYEDLEYKMGDWFSLSGEIVESDDWKKNVTSGTAKISDGGELVSLMKAYNKKATDATNITKITLDSDIDLMGSAANFAKVSGEFTIEGNGHKIYGVNSNESVTTGKNSIGQDSEYAYGLFGTIVGTKTKATTITLKNVKIVDAVIDDPENPAQVAHAGVIAGSIGNYGKLVLDTVTIENCYVRGEKKVGAIVGYMGSTSSTLEINKLTVQDTTVTGGREIAALVGFLNKGVITGADTVTKKNITVELDESYDLDYTSDKKIVNDKDSKGNKVGKTTVTTKDCWVCVGGRTNYEYINGAYDTTKGPQAKNFSEATDGKLTGNQ